MSAWRAGGGWAGARDHADVRSASFNFAALLIVRLDLARRLKPQPFAFCRARACHQPCGGTGGLFARLQSRQRPVPEHAATLAVQITLRDQVRAIDPLTLSLKRM